MYHSHKYHILASVFAVLAITFSFQLWTNFLLQNVPIEDIAFARDVTGTSATLRLHASATESQQWGLTRMWSLSIPSAGITSPVYLPTRTYWDGEQWSLLEEQMQIGMTEGVVAYPHSVFPGELGSLIVAGHSSPPTRRARESDYGNIFRGLPTIDVGDAIVLEEGKKSYHYNVTDTIIVSPEQTNILAQQYDESLLILITCYPVGTTRERLVVIAKLQENQ